MFDCIALLVLRSESIVSSWSYCVCAVLELLLDSSIRAILVLSKALKRSQKVITLKSSIERDEDSSTSCV